ncbi:MAG: hypothetical protein IJ756_05535 [Paludibacteraceae bacterium]|nr:hypothetical protein [Paludibacteraceae bacterium]
MSDLIRHRTITEPMNISLDQPTPMPLTRKNSKSFLLGLMKSSTKIKA